MLLVNESNRTERVPTRSIHLNQSIPAEFCVDLNIYIRTYIFCTTQFSRKKKQSNKAFKYVIEFNMNKENMDKLFCNDMLDRNNREQYKMKQNQISYTMTVNIYYPTNPDTNVIYT